MTLADKSRAAVVRETKPVAPKGNPNQLIS